MKFFVLIFVSLFFIQAHPQVTNPAPTINLQSPVSDERWNQERADRKQEQEAQACKDANKEYSDALKEDKKDGKEEKEKADDELSRLKKEKIKTASDGQEDLTGEDKKLTDAQTAYKKAQDDLTEEQNAFEKETNEQADGMIQDLQKDQATFQKLTTTDMDKINTDYQNNLSKQYGDCKNNAEQLFAARIGLDRQSNKLENHGLKKTGGATFATGSAIKKAKAEAKATYSKCISETNRVLGANRASAVKDLLTQQKAAEQEINNKKIKLDRLTNGEYTKKMTGFQEKLRTAQLEFTNVQSQVTANKQRIQQKMTQDMQALDQDIMMYQQRKDVVDAKTSGKKSSKNSSDDDDDSQVACENAKSVCCEKHDVKKSDGTSEKKYILAEKASFCERPCDKRPKAKPRYQHRGSSKGER